MDSFANSKKRRIDRLERFQCNLPRPRPNPQSILPVSVPMAARRQPWEWARRGIRRSVSGGETVLRHGVKRPGRILRSFRQVEIIREVLRTVAKLDDAEILDQVGQAFRNRLVEVVRNCG